jgi:predicted nucleic acid-binding protein
MDFLLETAQLYGKENARLRQNGIVMDKFDLLIATSALRHSLVVLTNNVRHYGNVEGLKTESIQI